MNKIPVSKPLIGEEEKAEVMAVLESGYIVQGPRVAALEDAFTQVCGVRHAVACSNGTTALHLALLAHDIGPGDEVITTPFTFIATANSILMAGATPVLVDVCEETFNLDPEAVARAVTPRTKAIMPVHLYGQMCEMDALQAIADAHNLVIIEDAAQAVGASDKGRRAGSIGTGAFSLYATKNIMSAEGGMVTTNDDEVAERLRLLRNHGQRTRYHYDMLGYNYRLTDLHAAIGLCQIRRLPEFTQRRQANAAFLSERIEAVQTPTVRDDCEHVWHQYTVRINSGRSRDEAVQKLEDAGVGTGVFYPIPAHQHDYMRAHVGELSLPVAERLAREVFSLPVHPQLTQDELNVIVDEVNKL